MNHRRAWVLSCALAVTLIAPGCSSDKSADGSEGTSAGAAKSVDLNGQKANNRGTKDVSGGGSEEVEVDDFYFNPTVFTGKAGDKLHLTLRNESKTVHNFSLPAQNVDTDIPAGGKATVTVTLPPSGTVVFFCKFHQSSGMLGGLQVESS